MTWQPWEVTWTNQAIRTLQGVDKPTRERLSKKMKRYAETGVGWVEPLRGGGGEWKLKHDDWRIVFTRRITEVKEQDTEEAPEQPAKAESKVSRELVVLAVTTRGSAYKK